MRNVRLIVFAVVLLIDIRTMATDNKMKYDFCAVCSTGQTLYYYIIDSKNVAVGPPEYDCDDDGAYSVCIGSWNDYNKPQGKIVIPMTVIYNDKSYNVERVRDNAFVNCNLLTSVTIPNSVEMIISDAFYGCNNLKELILQCDTPPKIGCSVDDIMLAMYYGIEGCEVQCDKVFPSKPILYVGKGLVNVYRKTIWGKCFAVIKEISYSASKNMENNLSKGFWRTHMNKVMHHVPGWYFDNMLYRGQEINVGYYVTASHGLGVNKWPDGTFYWGDWKDGDQHGYGIYICPDGYNVKNCSGCVYYVGNWYSDKKSGKGTCYDKFGNLIYYGDFSSNSPTETYPSTGSFSSYKFECIEYDNGNKYVGETKDGKRHGYGIFLWKNGDAWYGPWRDGIRDGYGMNLYYNGSITYGRWLNDTYYKSLLSTKKSK